MHFSRVLLDAACILYEREFTTLTEGINDPGILKAVFMAGGPGSGKSTVASELFAVDKAINSHFSAYGLKVVTSDTAFEYLLKKMGINPADLRKIAADDPTFYNKLVDDGNPDAVRSRASALTKKLQQNYMNGRLGVILDGTGDEYDHIHRKQSQLESYGYDTMMVFVNTDLNVALERNRNRPERSLPDSVVTELWHLVQRQRDKYRVIFAPHFLEVHNALDKDEQGRFEQDTAIQKAVRAFIGAPVQNPIGREWMTIQSAVSHLQT
jgi:cytidylate kinase